MKTVVLILSLIVLTFSECFADGDDFEFRIDCENSESHGLLVRRYIGEETPVSIFLYDKSLGKTIWKINRHASNHGQSIYFCISPNEHYAVITHEFGVKGQSFYWIDLTKGGPGYQGLLMDKDALEDLVATVDKERKDSFQDFFLPRESG